MIRWRSIMVGCIGALRVANAAACSPQDIELRQANWHMEDNNYVRIVGELYNGCSDAVGVQLQAVFRNQAGQIVIASNFWPASDRNIAAKDTYAFSTSEHGDQPVSTMSIRVIDVRQ